MLISDVIVTIGFQHVAILQLYRLVHKNIAFQVDLLLETFALKHKSQLISKRSLKYTDI
jgi:hypothetical protein